MAPGRDGVVAGGGDARGALRPDTRLVCLMLANNELGTLQPVAEVAAACRERGVPVLCDAVQAVGKVPVDVARAGGRLPDPRRAQVPRPAGRRGALGAASGRLPAPPFESHLVGGSQERRRRAGTENVPAMVGLGVACELAARELPARQAHLLALRERFEAALPATRAAIVHCAGSPRLPHTSHVAFPGLRRADAG